MAALTSQTGTFLGPLTTPFAIPETCTVNALPSSGASSAFQGQKCVTDLDDRGSPLQDNYKCWPPPNENVHVEEPQHPLVGWGFYSPGLACPTGYRSACTAVYGERPEWEIEFILKPSETAVGCCPENFQCTNSNGNKCVAVASTQTMVMTGECSGTDMVNSGLARFPEPTVTTDSASETEAIEAQVTLFAPMFQLNFQSSDLIAATQSTPSPIFEPIEETDMAGSGGGGLSEGGKIGVGVSLGLSSLALGVIGGWIYWRRWKQKRGPSYSPDTYVEKSGSFSSASSEEQGGRPPQVPSKAGLYGNSGTRGRWELGGTTVSELPSGR